MWNCLEQLYCNVPHVIYYETWNYRFPPWDHATCTPKSHFTFLRTSYRGAGTNPFHQFWHRICSPIFPVCLLIRSVFYNKVSSIDWKRVEAQVSAQILNRSVKKRWREVSQSTLVFHSSCLKTQTYLSVVWSLVVKKWIFLWNYSPPLHEVLEISRRT